MRLNWNESRVEVYGGRPTTQFALDRHQPAQTSRSGNEIQQEFWEVIDWCAEQYGSPFSEKLCRWTYSSFKSAIYFYRESDAVVFKMRWF